MMESDGFALIYSWRFVLIFDTFKFNSNLLLILKSGQVG